MCAAIRRTEEVGEKPYPKNAQAFPTDFVKLIIKIDRERPKISTFDLCNRHGDLICHARGCRKHTKLVFKFNGLFCLKHARKLKEIRKRIIHVNLLSPYINLEDVRNELDARNEEIEYRKIISPEHMYYINHRIADLLSAFELAGISPTLG